MAAEFRRSEPWYLSWNGSAWEDAVWSTRSSADEADRRRRPHWVDPRPVLLDSQIAVDRPRDGFGADLDAPTIRAASRLPPRKRPARMSPAVLDSVADALEREDRRS